MNPYEVLEISPGASPEEIKAAYHRMAKIWHPDRYTGDAKVEAESRFRTLAEAFNQIKDGGPRKEEAATRVSGSVPVPAPNKSQPIQLNEGSGDKSAGTKTADEWFKDAKTAFEAKEAGRALALILYSLRMDPERADFHAFHAKILEATGGNPRTKVAALETALKLNPKDVDSTILLAQTFQNLGMQARATRLWETVHNLAPTHPIFNPAPGKGKGSGKAQAKEKLQGLGEQFSALVAEARIALGKIFKRG
jgi:curved DNA-binding protein CbpA